MLRIHVFIHGDVQGIGYRYFVRLNAKKLGLKGFVRNLDDGRVEAVFEGNAPEIKKVLRILKDGHAAAKVKSIMSKIAAPTDEFLDFDII